MTLRTDTLQGELAAVSPNLPGNSDLLRSVLAGCGDCIKILDLDGRLQFMSEGGKRVMEVDDFAPLKGCFWPDFWTGAGNTNAAGAVAEAKAGRTGRFRGPANTARGTPRYWDVQVSPIYEGGNISQLLSISRDITEEWEASERERFLTEELTHRAKNTLLMILAIANQTFRDTDKDGLASFSARVMTLSGALDIARKSNWTNTDIREVVESALAMHSGRFELSGPRLNIAPKQALALTLAVNELATNAFKYGAMSVPDGCVDISWSGDGVFAFRWREHGGPPVSNPARPGFGTRVIREFLANDFGGTVELAYERSGFTCEITAPLTNLPKEAGNPSSS